MYENKQQLSVGNFPVGKYPLANFRRLFSGGYKSVGNFLREKNMAGNIPRIKIQLATFHQPIDDRSCLLNIESAAGVRRSFNKSVCLFLLLCRRISTANTGERFGGIASQLLFNDVRSPDLFKLLFIFL